MQNTWDDELCLTGYNKEFETGISNICFDVFN